MGRKYPRFLYCDAMNTKSEGPFIIHALHPKFICKPDFDKKRNVTALLLIDNWDNAGLEERWKVEEEIRKWFHFSGRQYSSHPKDRLLVQLSLLDFLKEYEIAYSIEEAIDVIRICFPTKTKTINDKHSSYGLKHLLEHISELHTPKNTKKYCSNDTMKAAFEAEGFNFTTNGPNCSYNISEKDFNNIHELIRR